MTWLSRLLHKRKLESDLRKELDYHLQRQTDDLVQGGMPEQEALRKARLEFGGTEQISEECREARGLLWLESIVQDVRLSLRLLRKSPAFTIAAIGTLALGIGANMAIFRLFDAVRLRALPVKDPQQLVMVKLADRTGIRGSQYAPYPALTNIIWEQFRDTQSALQGVLAWADTEFNTADAPGGEARLAHGLFVSGEFFRVLQVQPLMGRIFTRADDHRGCGLQGVVISYSFWQRQFAGDSSVIGKRITLNWRQTEVIGVTPVGFSGLEIGRAFDVAVPICSQKALWSDGDFLDDGTIWSLTVLGRLKPGSTPSQASAQLAATSPALFRTTLPANYPKENVKDYLKFKLQAVPATSGVSFLRDQYSDPLLLLLGITGLVLLIACANLGNLILARATARAQEFAIRLALGAARTRLIQQLMTEGFLLAVTGAAAGLLLSGILSRFLIAFLGTQGNPLFLDLQLDWRMFGFTLAMAALTCILFGLTPALQSSRSTTSAALKTGGRTVSASRERFGLRQTLIVIQVSLSLVLLATALLFSGSLRNLLSVDAGFQQNGILVANLDLSRLHIPTAQKYAYKQGLLEKMRAVPGIASAAEVEILPLSGSGTDNSVWKDGAPASKIDSNFNWASDAYLRTVGTALLSGRDFNERDTVASLKVAIVNQSFVGKLGFSGNPIGQRFRREATPSEPESVFEIVGVVRDSKYYSLREEFTPIAFLPVLQKPVPAPFNQFVIRSTLPLANTTSGIRNAIRQVNPAIGLDLRTFETNVREGLLRERLLATLSSFFGILAVLIASLGIYGVMSYLVARRTNEIGVRIALGASRRNILSLILRQAAMLLAAGLAVGALLAALVTGAMQSMLFGFAPHDVGMLGLSVLLLSVVTLLASYIPARRAAGMQPMKALRQE